jgi:rhamnulokinase
MKDTWRFLAFDLGAESGRAVLGTLKDGRIGLDVIHRFRTEGLFMLGTRQWDLARIHEEMCEGLAICARDYTPDLDGIGVDTWGVDFGLLAKDGSVIGNPVHYRDKRNEGMIDAACDIVPREEIYKSTGIQFLPFNTVYQLLSMTKSGSPFLEIADKLLMMGDLLAYLLSGEKTCEYTGASTTQMLDPYTGKWCVGLIEKLGLPGHLLLDPVKPGTVIGKILPDIADRTGISPETPVIAPAIHDTGAAVAAVPVTDEGDDWAYLSSGTWSLLGAELQEPCITDKSMAGDFTNEGGVNGTIRFLKNIIGLWVVQECRRTWEKDGEKLDYAGLTAEAEASEAFVSIIDLGDPRLMAPENMPETIQAICRETHQPVPETRGAIIRCALESLAMTYRKTLRTLDDTLGRKTTRLHIIGGGTQNKLLNQMTADACGIPVVCGPIEATALGNIGIQAMGAGAIESLAAMRKAVAASVELDRYEARNTETWDRLAGE